MSYDSINQEISEKIAELKKKKKWDDVISILSGYNEAQQENIYIYLELCIAYRELRDYKKALNTLKKAEKNNLQSVWIHDNYSRIYFEKKLYAKAIRECLFAIKISDQSNKSFFVELLTIIKKQLETEHSNNKFLNISEINVDNLLEKVLDEQVNPNDINLEIDHQILPTECKSAFEALEQTNIPSESDANVKLIAYYLPQFHPIIENDEWWGAGFTEWTNVAQAIPYFKEHYQPHVPGEFGYYDLRLPEVREAQAKLAKEYGIYGFCYYYYWFEGRRLLERPLQEVLDSGKPDFPFCICWANENWSRRWDGSENEILVQQVHNEQTDEDFIHDVIPLFKDPRYIKVNGAPLLIVYRISLMPNPTQTAEIWREICAENGIPKIHLCMAETFGLTEPRQYGFDSSVQFPPHNMSADIENDNIEGLAEDFTGKVFDFENVIKDQVAKEIPAYKQFPGVMTAWDNTARKKKAGNIFTNSTPESYEVWLRGAIDRARQTLPAGEQLVFINAWNEWAEGTHLEPDRKHGRGYLEATRRALTGDSDWHLMLDYAEQLSKLAGETKKNFLADMRFALERLAKVNEQLLSTINISKGWSSMRPGLPSSWAELNCIKSGFSNLYSLNQYSSFEGQRVVVDSLQKLRLSGWSYHDARQVLKKDTPTYIVLESSNGKETFFSPILQRHEQAEIATLNKNPNILFSGIEALIDISMVSAGCYFIYIACRWEQRVIMTPFDVEIEIV